MDKLVDCYQNDKMSFNQLSGNANILTAAGSETTATTLTGTNVMALPRRCYNPDHYV
jgi:cytochrome P450